MGTISANGAESSKDVLNKSLKNTMNYNNDQTLWENYFRSNPNAEMRFLDGAVWDTSKKGCLALFSNNADAMRTIEAARDAVNPERRATVLVSV